MVASGGKKFPGGGNVLHSACHDVTHLMDAVAIGSRHRIDTACRFIRLPGMGNTPTGILPPFRRFASPGRLFLPLGIIIADICPPFDEGQGLEL